MSATSPALDQQLSTHAKSVLPSEDDRLIFLQTISAVAAAIVSSSSSPVDEIVYTSQPPPSNSNRPEDQPARLAAETPHVGSKEKLRQAQERHTERLRSLLLDDLPRLAAAHLLLRFEEVEAKLEGAAWPQRRPEDAFGCVSLFLANHIIHCGAEDGYDARIRNAVKVAASFVLVESKDLTKSLSAEFKSASMRGIGSQGSIREIKPPRGIILEGEEAADLDMEDLVEFSASASTLKDFLAESYNQLAIDDDESSSNTEPESKPQSQPHIGEASRKFDAIEKAVASQLCKLLLTAQKKKQEQQAGATDKADALKQNKSSVYSRDNVIRGIKIGTAGVVAGALFAVTGGLAAPGIAAGMAALGVGTTAAAVAALTHTVALAALFGVGGGGLAAYKMKTRTDGLSEFRLRREGDETEVTRGADAEIRTTVCVSGWLTDRFDFQRPWGVTPSDPRLDDKLEILQRFYSIYNKEKVSQCQFILSKYEGREDKLWKDLEKKYGRDPDHLLPLIDILMGSLKNEEEKKLSGLLRTILAMDNETVSSEGSAGSGSRSCAGSIMKGAGVNTAGSEVTSRNGITLGIQDVTSGIPSKIQAWDFIGLYGGDMYTVTWESERLLSLCDYISALATKLAKDASKEILKWTALATLMSAVAWPSAVKKVADLIDEPWTMITIRSDEAGKELANCLLQSEERRPITLVGFSFGGRVVLSCLKELARHQEIWEANQQLGTNNVSSPVNPSTAEGQRQYEREPASIVDSAVLMGTPAYIDRVAWSACRRVVAGRLINCYSQKDWILKLMYQYQTTTGVFRSTCGTTSVSGVRGVENYDISALVTTQSTYCTAVKDILAFVGHGQSQLVMD